MKKSTILTLAVLFFTGISATAQVNKNLTNQDVQNFLGSTTHVVTTNSNIVYDAVLSKAAKESWTATPLSTDSYDTGSEEQSFLAITQDVFEKRSEDNRYTFLSLLQGRKGVRNVSGLPWIAAFPIGVEDEESEIDETLLIELLVKSTQYHAELLKQDVSIAKKPLGSIYNSNISLLKGKTIYMMDEDISKAIDRDKTLARFNGHLKLVGPDEIERLITEKEKDAVIAYTVTGGYSYKLLIGVEDGKIYYYDRARANNSFISPGGFTQMDISKLAAPFR